MKDTDNFIFLRNAGQRFDPTEQLTYYEVCLRLDNQPLLGRQTGEMADLKEAFSIIFDQVNRKAFSAYVPQPEQAYIL